jgi:hypothetical protein
MKKTIWINIAGDSFPVIFDGKKVAMTQFPDIPVEYTAPCGTKITQEMLVKVCESKILQSSNAIAHHVEM